MGESKMKPQRIENSEVEAAYDSYPVEIRHRLLELRSLILSMGNRIGHIGGVEENVKWGEPSYSTIAGSPVRLGWNKASRKGSASTFTVRLDSSARLGSCIQRHSHLKEIERLDSTRMIESQQASWNTVSS